MVLPEASDHQACQEIRGTLIPGTTIFLELVEQNLFPIGSALVLPFS
jgi:hypothetical protein